jgi:transposase
MPKGKPLHFSPQQKVSILRKHLLENVPISDLCQQHNIKPAIFYRWQKQFFEQGHAAFITQTRSDSSEWEKKLLSLEEKLQRKNEVLSELMEEHVKLKKRMAQAKRSMDST